MQYKKLKHFFWIPAWKRALSVVFALGVLCLLPVRAQDKKEVLSVKIDQIISRDFPNMSAYVSVQDAGGEIVGGLSPALFSSRIDSLEIDGKITVTPFTLKEEEIDYTILFSNNGIMDGEPLDFQKNAILQFIDMLKENDVLSLYTIAAEAVPVFEEQKKADIDLALINAVEINSEQPRVYDSLINVLRKAERRSTPRKVVIVISDGRDQNSRFTKDQLNTVFSETGIPVYTLGMRVLNNQSLSNLNEFASVTGGTYLYSPSLKTIPDNLKKIADYITHCYVIKYKVKNLKADNLAHYLQVNVIERDSQGKGEKIFVAVKVPVPRWVKWVFFALAVVALILLIVFSILGRMALRRRMGITRRRCGDCGNIMKDSWDSCPFCKYIPDIAKKKKKKEKKAK